MSSSPLVIMALTSFLVLPGGSLQALKPDTVTDLLSRDEFQQAEVLLDRPAPVERAVEPEDRDRERLEGGTRHFAVAQAKHSDTQ